MGYPVYERHYSVFAGTSANSSTFTSASLRVGGFTQMSLSWHSSGAASNLTVWATNEKGTETSVNTWSVITNLTAQGAYAIEPGMRWLRVTRSAIDSLGQVFLNART